MAYDLDTDEEAKISYHVKKFLLYPQFWDDAGNQIHVKLNWKQIKFVGLNKSKIPLSKGVYAFIVKPQYDNFFETNYLFYVGKTNRTLQERFDEYLDEQDGKGKPRKKLFKMLKVYREYLHFYYAELSNESDVDLIEKQILDTFVPHVNTQIPKAKIKPELMYIYEQ